MLFAGNVKKVTRWSQKMNLYMPLTASWDWSKKWDLPIYPAQCSHLVIEWEVPLRWVLHSHPCFPFRLDKNLGVQTHNVFSPSAQRRRRLIFLIRLSRILGSANSQSSREAIEALHSGEHSVNQFMQLDPCYRSLRLQHWSTCPTSPPLLSPSSTLSTSLTDPQPPRP